MKKILYLLLFISLASCCKNKDGGKNTVKKDSVVADPNNINVSILIDLSDRIDPNTNPNPTMEYYQRDTEYIKAIEKGFVNHIKSKRIITYDDQMQVFFNPEPSDPKMNELTKELKVSFNKDTPRNYFDSVDKKYSELPLKIYNSAIKDGKYVGSDIWEFFKNKVKDYCIKDDRRNILFILTDGYMYHQNTKFEEKNENSYRTSYLTTKLIKANNLTTSNFKDTIEKNSYGFVKANENLSNLEVIVLGINPEKGNPFEEAVIKEYWENWLKEMKIKNYQIKSADLPSNLEPIILKAISGK
ncbi:hypothetical protein BBH99_04400 [Chryseobacterium contaminans]|uniref:VWFA domain-containing protein n=1 Tax=Chryseobacterium contaminans TaxID=1423959 RepID=A0A1M6V3I5_9FLAO|nr:hypothetical protein [Chryseobacterium contaminans]OCA80334.1 hypothetical protein BBH99_04400 [Chryseobacterium contaminans]SHK76057.1 hypothetical protein SAMN05444407_10158 [Chryseobacterium contaminans]